MNSNENKKETPIIFSMGRKGTNVYNSFQEDMPCDYDLSDESSFDECHAAIESVIDDDRACIEKLIDNREAKKNNGYIMPQKPAGTGNYHKFNQDIRLKKLRAKIRYLCRNNFDNENAMHITLTFNAKNFSEIDFTNLETAKAEFRKFIKRMNGHYDNLRHITTFARQKNGNWHFHILCNLDVNTRQAFIKEIWKLGNADTTHKSDHEAFQNLISYLCKNLMESFNELTGEKAVLHSQGLQDNLVLTSRKKEDYFMMDRFMQHAEIEKARVYGNEDHYYIPISIDEYWKALIMATPKKTKFKHKKYRPRKRTKKDLQIKVKWQNEGFTKLSQKKNRHDFPLDTSIPTAFIYSHPCFHYSVRFMQVEPQETVRSCHPTDCIGNE